MNNADIDRLVSETIEPFETLPEAHGILSTESPLKAWLVPFNHYRTNDKTHRNVPDWWQPAPWLTDDRYAMRLVDEMAKAMIVIEIHVTDAYTSVFLGAARLMGKPVAIVDSDRRMAIVLAWLNWKGVPIEG